MFFIKKLFSPIKTISNQEAMELISKADPNEIQIVDVRQPKEFEKGHIPGAYLMPLSELSQKAKALDPSKTTIVY